MIKKKNPGLIYDILLVYVLLMGAYFRAVGLDWGEYQYLHPDERFLVWVGSDIQPVGTSQDLVGPPPSAERIEWRARYPEEFPDCPEWGGYFDASCSPLNPNNRGHGFYVYGTLPMFVTRYVVEWIYGHSGFQEMTDIGRPLSALADLMTILLVYLISARLYDRRVGLLAALFSSLVVLQIQLSHFFTMDTFLNFFTYLAIYYAVRVSGEKWASNGEADGIGNGIDGALELPSDLPLGRSRLTKFVIALTRHPYFYLSIAFGFALGCAVASKLNAAPVAIMLPAAFALTLLDVPAEVRTRRIGQAFIYLSLAAAVSVLVFRLFQPYAFTGPGFLGLKPNPMWVSNIREQRIQAAGDVDFPPALQWARRPVWFSAQNMVLWGLGLPLGVLAWAGFVWAGYRMLAHKNPWRMELCRHALLWGWTAGYFIWQSLAFNPTMRYQLPVYPALAIFAAWAVIQLWSKGSKVLYLTAGRQVEGDSLPGNEPGLSNLQPSIFNFQRVMAVLIGGGVLVATFAWAWAFSRIYVRPITRVEGSRWIYQNVPGPVNLRIQTEEGIVNQPLPFHESYNITASQPYNTTFTPKVSGDLKEVYLAHVLDMDVERVSVTLVATVRSPESSVADGSARLTTVFDSPNDSRGQAYTLQLDRPLPVIKDVQYQLSIGMESDRGTLTLLGSAPAHESTWDDGLPLRIEGYDAYGGIYQGGLNLEMYWDDNADKYERMVATLDQADYIFITSNRQWGSVPRVPERYPLSTEYYRRLLGCPPEREIGWCYAVAQVGAFKGDLGFELVKVFDSSPRIGSWVINDQFAEEAFTVYDHPKVMIFRKTGEYNPLQLRAILGSVDISQAIHVTPKRTSAHPANLMLTSDRWAQQRLGGTWSELFDTAAWYNRYPFLGALLWYVCLALLGWLSYPLIRMALPGLSDGGFPLARIFGLLLLSYLVWLAGSMRIPFSRPTISIVLGLMLVAGVLAFIRQRDEMLAEWRQRRGYFLLVEVLFLSFFLFDLLIRWLNPDLWHPWKGGEKPMDFSYFNAVLKSSTFPPYDPWFAGGYLNYYYYGFVFIGVLVKWLGIVPAVAYNLILPTVFALIALGAFSLGWNLFTSRRTNFTVKPLVPAIAASLGMAVLGNLGIVRMIYQGYQRLAAPEGVIDGANVITRWSWAIRGFFRVLTGAHLPYGIGDWYWNPSRVIPAPGDIEPINEFPFFTVLYADPHAHLFALPIALLALAFVISVVLGRARWQSALGMVAGFLLGGLAIGALYPINLSDMYTYLPIGVVAVAYAFWRYTEGRIPGLPVNTLRLFKAVAGVVALVALSYLLYQPYRLWYAQAYGAVDIWKGTHTPFWSYITHWGLFLFVIVSWMVWETRDWMATTPVSALRKLMPYKGIIQAAVVVIFLVIIGLMTWLKVNISWFVLPLAVWAGVLLLRPQQTDAKRFVLFLTGTGLVLTLMVEVVVVRGDIGRMNTVFKFYLQVWTLFSICAAAAFGWLLEALREWRHGWRIAWQVALTFLVGSAALFPILGGIAKIKDRMTLLAPHTLDGITFMQYAEYPETWGIMQLGEDYRAIRWMQENISGSPVIVEANQRNLYRWGSRYTIYTGLPGVVGWEWHQQQQRASLAVTWVSDRITEIERFYTTTSPEAALEFLRKYDVRYIIVGPQERGLYADEDGTPVPGFAKFDEQEGRLWRAVYEDGGTTIYEVIQN